MIWLMLLLIGLTTGFLAGLFGLGGGLLLVPSLSYALPILGLCTQEQAIPIAIATSLASVLVTGLSAAWAHQRRRGINWKQVRLLTPGLIIGAILGALMTAHLSGYWLAISFGILEVLIAVKIWFNPYPHPQPSSVLNVPLSWGYGMFSGSISSLLGIGGGTINTPWLLRQGLTLHQAIATASVLGIVIAFFGTLTNLKSDLILWPALFVISFASLISAYWGARTAHSVSVNRLSKAFASLVFLLGTSMLYQAFWMS